MSDARTRGSGQRQPRDYLAFAATAVGAFCSRKREPCRRYRALIGTAMGAPSLVAAAAPSGTRFSTLPQAKAYDSVQFPACVVPSNEAVQEAEVATFTEWAARHSDEIESVLRAHGAVLFRGFNSSSPTAERGQVHNVEPMDHKVFAKFVDSLGLPNFPYIGGNAVRTAIPDTDNRVFTANESPPDKPIPFHHELAQTPDFPRRILFFCARPAETGGETPIVLSTAVYEQLASEFPEFTQKLAAHGVVYSRVMTPNDRPESAIGRGWKRTFCAETRADVEKALTRKGYSWEWLDPTDPNKTATDTDENALLREKSPVLDAVKAVDGGNKMAFFNQLVAVWGGWRDEFNTPQQCIRHGDGSPLDAEAMDGAARIMREHAVAIPWQQGDIMYIDNMQAQHSRNTFTGPRRVLASLTR